MFLPEIHSNKTYLKASDPAERIKTYRRNSTSQVNAIEPTDKKALELSSTKRLTKK